MRPCAFVLLAVLTACGPEPEMTSAASQSAVPCCIPPTWTCVDVEVVDGIKSVMCQGCYFGRLERWGATFTVSAPTDCASYRDSGYNLATAPACSDPTPPGYCAR